MKLLTLMLKELIKMIEILQFPCYFKLGMSLQKLMSPVWQFLILLSFASREARKMALYNDTGKVAPKSSNRAFKYLCLH